MTSADFSWLALLHLQATILQSQVSMKPPEVRDFSFLSCSHCIYCFRFRTVLEFVLFRKLVHLKQPHIQFVFLGSGFCLQLHSANGRYCNPQKTFNLLGMRHARHIKQENSLHLQGVLSLGPEGLEPSTHGL